ncbi:MULTISPECIES: hypothetical protein [unclassified Streptomyces]|uniref:hypothetical protein n=1 Tax=unclassified Streptomyces TaxID=2593676 RepID=UPI0034089B7C
MPKKLMYIGWGGLSLALLLLIPTFFVSGAVALALVLAGIAVMVGTGVAMPVVRYRADRAAHHGQGRHW